MDGARTAVETVLLFVNTHADGGGKQELFGDGPALSRWIAEIDIASTVGGAIGTCAAGGARASDVDAADARELRDALITVLLAHSDDDAVACEAQADAETFLWSIAERFPLTSVVTARGANLVSRQTGVPYLMGTVLAAVVESALSGDWARVKACRNPPCHTGFFDHSRNRTAGFCSSGCRSQASMRAYRARRKAGPNDPAES
jgi:predicted RNA-binding Zn ribbon-like protein